MYVNKTKKPTKQGLRRGVSLFVLFSMLLVSLSLASCSVQDFINDIIAATEELPEGIVKTRVTLDDGEVVHIAHSENFIQDDIDFVVMLHGVEFDYRSDNEISSYTLADIINKAPGESQLFLAHFENPYIITAYLKPTASEYDDSMSFIFDATKYVWAKYNVDDKIPSTIEETYKKTTYSYLLYDCIVRTDLVSGIEYDTNYKYYELYKAENSLGTISEDMLVYWLGFENERFIRSFCAKYPVYIDEIGKEYLIFEGEIFDSKNEVTTDAARVILGEYYDTLYPCCTRNEKFDVIDYKPNGKDYYLYKMVQIELDVLVELYRKSAAFAADFC